jgi:hypothetical protein
MVPGNVNHVIRYRHGLMAYNKYDSGQEKGTFYFSAFRGRRAVKGDVLLFRVPRAAAWAERGL